MIINTRKSVRAYEELTLTNDFIFAKVMRDRDICDVRKIADEMGLDREGEDSEYEF